MDEEILFVDGKTEKETVFWWGWEEDSQVFFPPPPLPPSPPLSVSNTAYHYINSFILFTTSLGSFVIFTLLV